MRSGYRLQWSERATLESHGARQHVCVMCLIAYQKVRVISSAPNYSITQDPHQKQF